MDIHQHNFKWWQWPIYTLQMLLAVFVATVFIANICGTPISSCLIGAALEHYSGHKTLSNIIGTDLTIDTGLDCTLIGDGVASAVGIAIGSLPNTSYGESIVTIGFSKIAPLTLRHHQKAA